MNPQEYFLFKLPDLSCGTATSSIAYARSLMHLFAQYQCYDQPDDLVGFRYATQEWDDRVWAHDIYVDAMNFVFEPMQWFHHDLTLEQRLGLCIDRPNTDPEMVLKWLGREPIGACPDGLYCYLAGCVGFLFIQLLSNTTGRVELTQALQGWREILLKLVALGDAANFGKSSVLKFLLSGGSPSVGFFDTAEAKFLPKLLTWITRCWIQELKVAGMLDEALKSFADNEHKYLVGTPIRLADCDCVFEITSLSSGARPEDWCVYGKFEKPAFCKPALSELMSTVPGGWTEDSDSKQGPDEDEIGGFTANPCYHHTGFHTPCNSTRGYTVLTKGDVWTMRKCAKPGYRRRAVRFAFRNRKSTIVFPNGWSI